MKRRSPSIRMLVCVASLLLAGCATGPNANPKDPLEPMNRSISRFNDVLDDNVLKPVATGYKKNVPDLVQTGVRNVFNNLSDIWSTVNNGLQLKGRDTVESLARVVVNTTVGIYGLFDVASHLNLERHPEDFGQTLGYWGMPSGPYVVLPLFGPSSVRDGVSTIGVDMPNDLVKQIDHIPTRNATTVVRLVNRRASLLGAGNMLEEASIDKYAFTRDAYFQYRRSQIYDGNPPEEEDIDNSEATPSR
jgi:phospholipid-binding lipoprotein MlaA